jgi:serine/threonine protein kinase
MPETLPMDLRGLASPSPEGAGDGDTTRVLARAAKLRAPRYRSCPVCKKGFSGEARFCPFDGDALVDAPDWNPGADSLLGQVVDGRYRVERVLGEGGMGTVYEVRHLTLGRAFAMKVLKREVLDDDDLFERFTREAKAAAAIGHPNIVGVTDFGELSAEQSGAGRRAVPYFVMELLAGKTLSSVLRAEHVLTPKRAAGLFAQCAAALQAAHEAGVLHRDLKPDNVFLVAGAASDFVKILDFGVAKIAGAGRLTRAGRVFGTPHYMSPEQARGEEIDGRADVYALGVMMYESFAGKTPFEADTYMGVLTQHLFAQPEPIDTVAVVGKELGALGPIVMRCLQKDRDARYPDMASLARALEAATLDGSDGDATLLLERKPAKAPPLHLRDPLPMPRAPEVLPSSTRGTPPTARRGGLLAVVAAVLALSVGVLAWAWVQRGTDSRAAPAAVTQAAATSAPLAAPTAELPSTATPEPPPPVAVAEAEPLTPMAAPLASAKPPRRPTTRPATPPKPPPPPPAGGEIVDPWR